MVYPNGKPTKIKSVAAVKAQHIWNMCTPKSHSPDMLNYSFLKVHNIHAPTSHSPCSPMLSFPLPALWESAHKLVS